MSAIELCAPPNTPEKELTYRIQRFREAMLNSEVSAIVITSRINFEYLTGYRSTAWGFQARPMFAILSLDDFIVVDSMVGERYIAMHPRPFRPVYYNGFQAEAVKTVIEVIRQLNLGQNPTVAIDYGQDIFGRGSLELIDGLRGLHGKMRVISGEQIVWSVRKYKTQFEANLKKRALAIVDVSFDKAIANARVGITELELLSSIKVNLIQNGAEHVDDAGLKFGKVGFVYTLPAGDRRLEAGDYIWSDFYTTYCGYSADRCRIARCGEPSEQEAKIYHDVRAVTIGLCESIRPGMTCSDVYRHFERLWSDAGLPPNFGATSRIGHSSGMEVTEPTSIASWSEELIEVGMILQLEPKLEKDGTVVQFEEVVYVRPDGVEFLSAMPPETLPVISIE